MRANKIRFRPTSGPGCRIRESISKGQVRQPDGTAGRPDEQGRVGREVGVDTQRGAADEDLNVVAVTGCGKLGGDESPQASQPGRRRAPAPHLAIEGVRHPHFHTSRQQTRG